MRDQWGIRKLSLAEDMIKYIAAYSSKPFVIETVKQLLGVARMTIDSYLNAIEAMHLCERLNAWTTKDYDRPGKTPKLFMTDSGLMLHVIGVIHSDDILSRPVRSQNEGGKLVETWIYNQLMPEIDLHPLWKIYHLRTKAHEIDFLIENDKEAYLGIEVKSGESVNSRDFKHLKWFGSQIDRPFRRIVLYAGEKVRSFGDNCYAITMASLWNAS